MERPSGPSFPIECPDKSLRGLEPAPDPFCLMEVKGVKCPRCDFSDTRVIETRPVEGGEAIRRRRECPLCSYRFTTCERAEGGQVLWIRKKDGRREAFDREKIVRGMSRACEKLPVSLEAIEEAAASVEKKLRGEGGEIPSSRIGDLVMEELRQLDKVAYVRFAAVYREFTDLNTFQEEIRRLIREDVAREDSSEN